MVIFLSITPRSGKKTVSEGHQLYETTFRIKTKKRRPLIGGENRLQIGLLMSKVKFLPNILAVNTDRSRGQIHHLGNFLGSFSLSYKICHLYFRRGEPYQSAGKVIGKLRGKFSEVGLENVEQHLLLIVQPAFCHFQQIWFNKVGNIGNNLLFQGRFILLSFF